MSSIWGATCLAERVVEAVRQYGAKVVGLSALMTTTVPSMEKTIARLHENGLHRAGDRRRRGAHAGLRRKESARIITRRDAKQSADIAKSILG